MFNIKIYAIYIYIYRQLLLVDCARVSGSSMLYISNMHINEYTINTTYKYSYKNYKKN